MLNETKSLGIIVDEGLNWNEQFRKVNGKVSGGLTGKSSGLITLLLNSGPTLGPRRVVPYSPIKSLEFSF